MRRWALVLFCVVSAAVAAADYPSRPIRMVVPNAPGSGPDIIARLVGPMLSQRLGQAVTIDDRPGAGTMLGGDIVAKAAPDGYTLLMGISTLAINPSMYRNVPYDALKDFAPITHVASLPFILVVNPQLEANSVRELIALARAHPGKLNFASAGTGSASHLAVELLRSLANIDIVHVPYKGDGPGIVDLLAGRVSLMMPNILTAMPHVKAGRLKALGVSSARPATAAPQIPAIGQAGVPGYEVVQWYGLLAPARTPDQVVRLLHREMTYALQQPEVRQRLLADGAEPVGSTPEAFAAFLRSETDKWAKIIPAAGITPE